MNTDFRITIDAFDHPKIVKLQRLCGEHGVICLFRLWGFTARYHPRGDLNNMTDEDIEIAAKWNGKPGVFFSTLIKFRMLDEMLGAYSIHDWEEHNAYAFRAPERSERARNAARVRWESDKDADSNATGNANGNAGRNAPSPSPSPSPAPSPDPSLKKKNMPPKDGGTSQSEKSEKKKKYIPIEDRDAKTPNSKLVRYWHRLFRKVYGTGYVGDIKKMAGQVKIALRKNEYETIKDAMEYLFALDQDKYVRHDFDHFIRKLSHYIIEKDRPEKSK